MSDRNEQARPGRLAVTAVLVAVASAIAAAMYYPFEDTVISAGATGAPLTAETAADPSRFSPDAWYLPADPMLGFVAVPAGPFIMGSDPAVDPQAFENERWSETSAQGTVDLSAFYIGRYEVTVAQFRAFVEDSDHVVDEQTLSRPADHPIVGVSWTDALAYARWLERKLRESPTTAAELQRLLETGWHLTLPTEAQWEKAARGSDGRIFPWGDQPRSDRANFAAAGTLPVGSFDCPECSYGLHDMSGNVWEWTRSPYQPLPYSEADDREGLEADALWVMRGGSFADPPELVRAALRGGADPGVRRPFIGFRLVISKG
ncbi:MAG: SUMF1/EgtB/PvdO family nonheme iron enzyme [Gemmatimonadota bacterium]